MRWCVTGQQMQEIERKMIQEVGIPSIVLMERAALAVVDVVEENVGVSNHIWVMCGIGNNGADGIAVARILWQKGYSVDVITIGNYKKITEEYKVQERIAKNIGVPFMPWETWKMEQVEETDCLVDGIFGIGLAREITGDYRVLIERMNQCASECRISIDIPSGIAASNGELLGCALKVQHTVTFGYEKTGLYLGEGRVHAGRITVADIGVGNISKEQKDATHCKILEENDCKFIPQRREDANKGTYGKLLIVAGSEGMCGAAYLSAVAAYRMGAGLVKILTVESNRQVLQMRLPEAIVQVYSKSDMRECVKEACQWATHVVMGPGLSQKDYVVTLVEAVLQFTKERNIPTVLDSDALNIIASHKELEVHYGRHIVITPHMKEMSRLTNQSVQTLKLDAIGRANSYCEKYGITCIMKDAVSVVTNGTGEIYINTSGNSALAKGGSGDVLTGIIGGLLCLGMDIDEAAAYGAFLHGRAGTKASEVMGKHGVLASDLVEYLW